MGKGNTFINDWLKLIFNATAIANIADNASSGPLTSLWVALHTADPGAAGGQATSETTYTGYLRVATARSTAATGWTASASQTTSPVSSITFAAGTGGTGTATYFSIGTTSTTGSAGKILYSGTVTPNIVLGNGITPSLTTASAVTEA